MKVALVHDWLTGMRGGEKCLEVFCELFPDADLFTLLHIPGATSPTIENMRIHTSALQRLPLSATHYRYYLPLFPAIVDRWKTSLETYDLVLSSSHCVAKGVRFPHAKRHVCYCFTPMRYLWCQGENYYQGTWKQAALNLIKEPLKKWDQKVNTGVHEFIGISDNVSHRIRNFYHREAVTIYPPVDTEFYTSDPKVSREDFYLVAGALEPYKRVDLPVELFRKNRKSLKVVGKGTMMNSLKKNAPSNIEFLGWRSNEEIRTLYRTAKGLIFPGEEDFGIVPLEAQACGCPVIAYHAGGILETVLEGITGIFFNELNIQSLEEALSRFEKIPWNPSAMRTQSEKFSRPRFKKEIADYLAHPR